MKLSPLLTLLCALAVALCAAHAAHAVSVVLLPDHVLTPSERDDVRAALRDAGHTIVDDADVRAAVDGARGACAHDDVSCLARIALLADAGAVLSFARRGEEIDVVVVDADPRVGRRTTAASRVGSAVIDALASLSAPPPDPAAVVEPAVVEPAVVEPAVVEPAVVEPAVEPAHVERAHVARAPEPSKEAAPMNPWALAGAGLAGAGLVAVAAGSYAAVLASGSMKEAEAAPFQDDSARFGDTANGQLWLTGGALALGVGAMAGGVALIFIDGEP